MTSAKVDKLVRMANQIAEYFAPLPEAEGASGVANHLKRFWAPKMIAELVERSKTEDCGLNEIATRGVERLRGETSN